MRRLASQRGVEREPGDDRVREAFAAHKRDGFWLDVEQPSDDDVSMLREVFGFHSLALDEVRRNTARPRLNEFEGYAFLTLVTAEWVHRELHLSVYHLFVGRGFLVTLHGQCSDGLDSLLGRLADEPERFSFVAYLAADALVDSLFPALDELDGAIDDLQDRTMSDATPQVLAELHRMKSEVVALHRMLGSQIDAMQRLTTHLLALHAEEQSRYIRNVYDHAVRQFEIVDSLRDQLSSAMDVYLSTVSNKLNVTMMQLTVIASLFLPLTFLTGFFGMNFEYLTSHIGGPLAFAIGMVVMGLTILLTLWIFRRRRWI
jgi:magnesium transporter